MKALVTGAGGFVGRHLVAHLRAEGDEVQEAIGPHAEGSKNRMPVDVRDAAAVNRLLESTAPDAIYHLAAVAYGPDASADLPGALAVTVAGTANILEAAASLKQRPIVLVSGSAEVYGAPELDRIPEETPLRPVNAYGATKVAQEAVALGFARSRGVPVIATRSFNHIGPGQRDTFVMPAFARQLAEMTAGRRGPTIHVGNLDPVRDFSDVEDVVAAYRRLVLVGHTGEAVNVASGEGVSVGELLSRLIELSGLRVEIRVDPARVRRHDPRRIVGDPSRLHRLTGWRPHRGLEDTLGAIWQDAQQRYT